MSSVDLFSLTAKLDSSKLRDRNEALEQLDELVRTEHVFTHKELMALLDSLFRLMDTERTAYSKNATPAVRTRLETSSYIFRRIVSSNPKRLKYRVVKKCLDFIHERLFGFTDGIFQPWAKDLSKVINTLLSVGEHREHLSGTDWVKHTLLILKALKKQLKYSMTEKFVSDLLNSLRCMVQVSTLHSSEIVEPLTEFVIDYFNTMNKATASTATILEITNSALLILASRSIAKGIEIVKYVTRHAGAMVSTHFDPLKDQLLVFALTSSYFVHSDIAPLIGEDGERVPFFPQEFAGDCRHWIAASIVHQLSKTTMDTFSIEMLEFYNERPKGYIWPCFETMGISAVEYERCWMTYLAIVNTVNAYFTLDLESQQQPLWKRTKDDSMSIIYNLDRATTPVEFYKRLLLSEKSSIQAMGLQLLTFHISSTQTPVNSISIGDVLLYKNKQLAPWVSLALRTMLQHGWELADDESNEVLRINLQMVKERECMNVACQLVLQVLSTPSFFINDRSINQLIRSVFEVPQVYGPDHISNDSMKFWMAISEHAKFLNNSGSHTGDMIINWLAFKLSTSVFERADCTMFPHFILWLAGKPQVFQEAFKRHDTTFTRVMSNWYVHAGLLRQISNTKFVPPVVQRAGLFENPRPPSDLLLLDSVINQVIECMIEFDRVNQSVVLIKLIRFGIFIYQGIYQAPQLYSASERLKYELIRLLEGLTITPENRDAVMSEMCDIKTFNNGGTFILDSINVGLFTVHSRESSESVNTSSVMEDEFTDFGSVRKHHGREVKTQLPSAAEVTCVTITEQLVVRLILGVYSGFEEETNLSTGLEAALKYMETLEAPQFALCFVEILEVVENTAIPKVTRSNLRVLLRLCGTVLLGSYEMERSPLSFFSMLTFFTKFSDELLTKDNELLIQDFADVFDFLLRLVQQDQLYDEYSCGLFSKLLLKVRANENAIELGNPVIFDEVLSKIWCSRSQVVKFSLGTCMGLYLSKMDVNSQLAFVNKFVKMFTSPESSDESASVFCIFLSVIAHVSFPLTVLSINTLSRYHSSFHFSKYVGAALARARKGSGEDTALTGYLWFEILGSWYTEFQEFQTFPFSLFGYRDLAHFRMANQLIMAGICLSHTTCNQTALAWINGTDAGALDDLRLRSMSYAISFSYTKHGKRDSILKSLSEDFDMDLVLYQNFIIAERLIHLLDVSKESDFLKFIPGLQGDTECSKMIDSRSEVLYPLQHMNVALADGISLLRRLFPKSFTPQVLHFLTRRLVARLETTSFTEEKIIALRKLKLVLFLGRTATRDDNVSLPLVLSLKKYALDEKLHLDVSVIMTFLLSSVPSLHTSCLYPEGLMQIYDVATRYFDSGKTLNADMKEFLVRTYALIDPKDPWKTLFSPFIDVLSEKEIRMTLLSLHNGLKYVSQYCVEGMTLNIFRTMSLVFAKNPEKALISVSFQTHKEVAKLLLRSTSLASTDEVKTFIARYLGRYYIQTGHDLKKDISGTENATQTDVLLKYCSLREFADYFITVRTKSQDVSRVIHAEATYGALLYDFDQDTSLYEKFFDTEKQIVSQSRTLLLIDSFQYQVQYPYSWDAPEVGELVTDEKILSLPTEEWCLIVVHSICETLSTMFPWAVKVISYIRTYNEAAKDLFTRVWMLYIFQFASEGAGVAERFFTTVFSNIDSLDKEKMELIVELIDIMRAGSLSHKLLLSPFQKLDLEACYSCAMKVDRHKLALSLFEKHIYPPRSASPIDKLNDNSEVLAAIYRGIDDEDLVFGVPVKPSLDYAIDMLDVTRTGMEQVMFDSARFDSCRSERARSKLFSSLAHTSLLGLSSLVNEYTESTAEYQSSYDWCWKLNQWDIVAPENPQTEGEIIYTALKAMKERKPQSDVETEIEKLMRSSLNSEHEGLLRTLSALLTIQDICSCTVFDLRSNIESYLSSTEHWFKVTRFVEFESLITVRRIAFEAMASSTDDEAALLASVNEFARYGKFSRLHGDHQKSINNTVLLDQMCKKWSDHPFAVCMKKVSNFESASTLWTEGDSMMPLAILTNDLKTPISVESTNFPMRVLKTSDTYLMSYLVKWSSESRQKKFEQIMQEYVDPAMEKSHAVPSSREKAEALHNISYFCYKYFKTSGIQEEIEEKQEFLDVRRRELNQLKIILKNKTGTESDRRNAKRFYNKITQQMLAAQDSLDNLIANKDTCVLKCIQCLLLTLSISDEFDDEDLDRLCGLWLQFSGDDAVIQQVDALSGKIPGHKFIPWLNQLSSRLSIEDTAFQSLLQELIERICYKHPFHSLYYLVNLRVNNRYNLSKTDKSIGSRTAAADIVWARLKRRDANFDKTLLTPLDELCNQSLKLATEKAKNLTKLHLENLTLGTYWLKKLPTQNLPLPTLNNLPVSRSGQYDSVPRISSVDPVVNISPSGISLPKIMKVMLNNASTHRMLFKGSMDDLRQDAIMEQVFEKVNLILKNDRESRKRNLRIRTYKVVPLGPQAGVIEFLANSMSLCDILKKAHFGDRISFEDARTMMKDYQQKSQKDRIMAYNKIAKDTPPAFRHFFVSAFPNVDDWFKSRQIYTRGVVTTSIVGYVLGLGDRHLNNILIDKKTGEPIHIDLGVAFDQGKLLPVPELVPFRLTRDMVDGLGVTGVNGAFRKGCELVFRAMKDNSEKIIGILDVLRYDPLYTWAISPLRKKRQEEMETENDSTTVKMEDDGSEAVTALKGVEDKLMARGLSVEATVQELIQEATDVKNLAVIYLGWAPFY